MSLPKCPMHQHVDSPIAQPTSSLVTLSSIRTFAYGSPAFRQFLLKQPTCSDCFLQIKEACLQAVEEERVFSLAEKYPPPPVDHSSDEGRLALEAELETLNHEYSEAEAELNRLEVELKNLEVPLGRLNFQNKQFYREIQNQELTSLLIQEEIATAKEKVLALAEEEAHLRELNVYLAVFPIVLSSEPATISGFRCGTLLADPTPKFEINSAFGQVALILYLVIRNLGLKTMPTPVPLGNRSLMDTGQARLALWTKAPIDFTPRARSLKSFWTPAQVPEFELGLSALLVCLRNLTRELSDRFGHVWKYEISDVTVGLVGQHHYPVTLASNNPKSWNTALR